MRPRFRLAAALSLVFLCVAPAHALETISGTVTDAVSGLPLAGMDLDVFTAAGKSVVITGGTTGVGGTYTLVLPGPGDYIVRADPKSTDNVAALYFNNVMLKSQAQALTVGLGAALTGVDFALPRGVTLSGTVTSGGVPAAGIDLDLYAANGEFLSAYPGSTALDGTYTLGALAPGTYFLRADPDITLGQFSVVTFVGGSMTLAGAAPIVVGTVPLVGLDIAMPAGGTIAGVARDATTALPLAGFDLDVFDLLGTRMAVQAVTAADGSYEIGALAPGSYTIRVDPTVAQGYARTYFTNATTAATATPVVVSAGLQTPNVDFSVGLGGTISGTISLSVGGQPLAGVDLDLFDITGAFMAAYTDTTDTAGAYQLGPMRPGLYFVRADPAVASGLAEQFYLVQPDISSATVVAVNAGTDTAGVDFALVNGGSISGVITDQGLTPLAGIDLDLFDALGTRLRQGAKTAADGSYTFASLTPGTYSLRADPTPLQGYARIYYNAKVAKALADPVQVTGGAGTAAIDFALPLAGSISGRVTDPAGLPVAGIDLDVLEVAGAVFTRLAQGAKTDAFGDYTINALPPGNYVVRADPLTAVPTYHGGTLDRTQATVIALAPGQAAAAVDIQLLQAAIPCGDANADGAVNATDALDILKVGVGSALCAACICDLDSSGTIAASDALLVLEFAVSQPVTLNCPVCP